MACLLQAASGPSQIVLFGQCKINTYINPFHVRMYSFALCFLKEKYVARVFFIIDAIRSGQLERDDESFQ